MSCQKKLHTKNSDNPEKYIGTSGNAKIRAKENKTELDKLRIWVKSHIAQYTQESK